MIKNCRSILLAVGAAGLAAGCAPGVTMQQLEEVRATADEALRTANTADYQAHQAKTMADEALTGIRMHTSKNRKMKGMGSMMK